MIPPRETDPAPPNSEGAPQDAAGAPAPAPEDDKPHPLHRRLKSFVKRGGRTTFGQARAYEVYGPQFLVPYQEGLLDLAATFGREAPTVLEIGFGMGEATAHIAGLLPETNFLCCEVHEPGVGALLKRIGEHDLKNIRICAHDAVDVIDHMLAPGVLAGVHVFFPDPWHKTRHNKRRLIQGPLVRKLAERLKTGGYLHCATDWKPYAEQMVEVLRAEPLLQISPDASPEGYAPKPHYRPLTKFENRGIKLGHGVYDVLFTKT